MSLSLATKGVLCEQGSQGIGLATRGVLCPEPMILAVIFDGVTVGPTNAGIRFNSASHGVGLVSGGLHSVRVTGDHHVGLGTMGIQAITLIGDHGVVTETVE